MLRTRQEWFDFAIERGTSGDMVFDILADWKKERKRIKQELLAIIRTSLLSNLTKEMSEPELSLFKLDEIAKFVQRTYTESAEENNE